VRLKQIGLAQGSYCNDNKFVFPSLYHDQITERGINTGLAHSRRSPGWDWHGVVEAGYLVRGQYTTYDGVFCPSYLCTSYSYKFMMDTWWTPSIAADPGFVDMWYAGYSFRHSVNDGVYSDTPVPCYQAFGLNTKDITHPSGLAMTWDAGEYWDSTKGRWGFGSHSDGYNILYADDSTAWYSDPGWTKVATWDASQWFWGVNRIEIVMSMFDRQ
jgi:hypothetical protein